MRIKPLLALASPFLLLACSTSSGRSTSEDSVAHQRAVRAIIDSSNAKGVAAFNAGDYATFGKIWADDATLMKIDGPDHVGRAALDSQLALETAAGRRAGTVSWKADSVEVRGDFAYEIGRGMGISQKTPSAKPETGSTRYITFWRRDSTGTWRVTRDFTVPVPKPTAAVAVR